MNNDIVKVIIIIMQLITIQFAVRVRKDYTRLLVYLGCVWVVIYVKYITYEDLLHNTLALDVDTVQEVCVYTANCSYEKKIAVIQNHTVYLHIFRGL